MNLKVSYPAIDCTHVLRAVDDAHRLTRVDCASMLEAVDCGHMLTGDAMLRGVGLVALKSAPLSFVSMQPSDLRIMALVLLAAGAGALPLKQVAVVP
ncbi:MAG TPA: hypothetical protein VK893_15170, partial [Pyrinomonadaceae bacterium]|nr:hypothetical protein [Pyrinomonadaceae bacterium]